MKKYLKSAFISTLPIMAGYIFLGLGFGIIAQKNGYGLIWAGLMSCTIYAGAMQYVAVDLLSSGASIITAAVTTLMVNARHLFYGISMVDKYKGAGKFKPYLAFSLTDETYSLVCRGKCPEGFDYHKYCFFVSLFDQIYWIIGGLLGVAVGSAIKFDTTGIDFSMTALFITVFVEQWKSTKNHFPALCGIVCTALCLVIFGKESFLIPSMLLISLVLSLSKSYIEKKEAE